MKPQHSILLCQVDGHPSLVDFKNGKPVKGDPYQEWSLQSAAYRECLRLVGFDDLRSFIVVLYRDGSGYEVHELERDPEPAFQASSALLETRRWMDASATQLPGPGDLAPAPKRKAPPSSSVEVVTRAKEATEQSIARGAHYSGDQSDPVRGFRA